MKKLLKLLATDYRKLNLYGDWMALEKGVMEAQFRGKRIDVKILGLFWVTYSYYTIR